jgi:hypothetical protein
MTSVSTPRSGAMKSMNSARRTSASPPRADVVRDEAEVVSTDSQAMGALVEVRRPRTQRLREEVEVHGADSHEGGVKPAVIRLEAQDPGANATVFR